MKPILAIDPGAAGGFAWIDAEGTVNAEPMPDGMTGQADRLRSLVAGSPLLSAVVEKVGTYRPGNSGPAAATFARHCGNIEAVLYLLGIPTKAVAPGVWQRCCGSLSKEKAARKRSIKEQMARSYPHVSVTLKTADALGILTWAMSQ